MKDDEIGTLYGLMGRLKTDLNQALYYMKQSMTSDDAQHFVKDAEYTLQSLKSLIDKTKLK